MRYHNITKDDMLNGDGLRVVLWVSGCSHCCRECHNSVTWDPAEGLLFDDKAKKEIYKQLEKPYISGITFSGGDPLFMDNRLEIEKFISEIKNEFPHKTIWLYTGYDWENLIGESVIEKVDVLVDGKFEADKKNPRLLWKGSANQRVIDVKRSLMKKDPQNPVLYCGDYKEQK